MTVFRQVILCLCLSVAMTVTAPRPAHAQEGVFIQIEALPSLNRAEERVRDYTSTLQDVNGFALGGGWYGIALGPYPRDAAQSLLTRLRRAGQIPNDSYLVTPEELRQQFWPVGAALNRTPQAVVPAPVDDTDTQEAATDPGAPSTPVEPLIRSADETPREARASERALSRAEREELQVMLKWAGFYAAAIDGAFGRGTRASMAAWQEANSYEPTGVLTTGQRAELLRQYNAVLEGMDLQVVSDETAGIRLEMPLGAVTFDAYNSPFATYKGTGAVAGAQVILISQPGDQTTLFGLYDILQTLEIVPLDGPRERRNRSFTINGTNSRVATYVEAGLVGGAVKGFILVWPAGDEERRTRILTRMQGSFRAIDGVLDPSQISDDAQTVDLVSGLDIRKPRITRSGFYIDRSGAVLTTLDAVSSCSRITIDDAYEATVSARDETLGVALLRPGSTLSPMQVAAFRSDTPRLKSEVAVAGYSYGGALSAPSLTFGTLADLSGLQGEEQLKRLALNALPGDAGGPVLDAGGAVLGMLVPADTGARQLPDGVSFAVNAAELRAMITRAGLSAQAVEGETAMAPEDLTLVASGLTVLVSCWD